MDFNNNNYINRLIDKKVSHYLNVVGALNIVGPKWCGKTWTSKYHSKSFITFDNPNTVIQANSDLDSVLNYEKPELIDEWNRVPQIWDRVRNKCDETSSTGNYILTCSTTLTNDEQKKNIFHSGAGRIAKINMYTMSLYEFGDSTGEVSLTDLLENTQKSLISKRKYTINEIANFIIRGGWPANINKNSDDNGILPKMYINSILDKDINDDKERNREKMLMILKSLSRNESSMAGIQTIQKDITDNENGEDSNLSWNTITDYIDVLDRLYLIENQPAYGISYRSSKRIGTSFKRHLTDPSLACACLNLNSKRLLNDMNTFGFMFEALVERDLRIYMDYLNGQLYHFRDNTSGDEVDAILEFEDGEYAAIEIKLGFDKFNEAKDSLQRFYKNVKKKPKFMAMIYGPGENIIKDKETGIYAFPITTLKP